MASPQEQYTREMHEKFGYLAIWAPNVTLKLGDVGVITKHEFSFMTTLEERGIKFRVRRGDRPASYEHRSAGGVSVHVKAAGEAPPAGSLLTTAEAGVSVKFSRAGAVYFRANGMLVHMILDQERLGKEILNRYELGEWEEDYAVVTELLVADASTILISHEGEAQMDLKAGADFNPASFDIASGRAGLTMASIRNMQTTIVGESGLTLLFKARKVKRSFFGGPIVRGGEGATFEELSYNDVS